VVVVESTIELLISFAKTLIKYAYGIINHCRYPIHRGCLEGVNNKIRVIKRKAYGFHDTEYFSLVIKNAFIDVVKPTELSSIQLENQKELLSHLEFEVPEVREFYKALNIGRFAIENINLDMEFLDTAPRMYCDFYYPHITLANSKACDIAGAFDDQRGHFVHEDCSRYCNYASLEFGNADTLKLQQRYNTVYKTNTQLEVPNVLKKNSKNRFIWELFL